MRRRVLKFMRLAVFGGATLWILLSPGVGYATDPDITLNTTFSGTIIKPLTLNQVTALDFGRIERPTLGNQRFRLLSSGTKVNLVGGDSNDGSFVDGQVVGVFLITGTPSTSVLVNGSPIGGACSGGPQVGLTQMSLADSPTFNTATVSLDGNGDFNLLVGGEVLIQSVASGTHICDFNLDLTYQ